VTVLVNDGQVASLACRPNGSSGPAALDILLGTFGRKPWIELTEMRE